MEIENDLLNQIKKSNSLDLLDVERHQLVFSVSRPKPHTFFRINSDWEKTVPVYENSDGELFIIKESLIPDLHSFIKIKMFFCYITRDGVVGFWGINKPDPDKKTHPAIASALIAAEKAKENWLRVVYNKKSSSYETVFAKENLGDSKWPDRNIDELFVEAFKRNYIDSLDHSEVRKLEGYEK